MMTLQKRYRSVSKVAGCRWRESQVSGAFESERGAPFGASDTERLSIAWVPGKGAGVAEPGALGYRVAKNQARSTLTAVDWSGVASPGKLSAPQGAERGEVAN